MRLWVCEWCRKVSQYTVVVERTLDTGEGLRRENTTFCDGSERHVRILFIFGSISHALTTPFVSQVAAGAALALAVRSALTLLLMGYAVTGHSRRVLRAPVQQVGSRMGCDGADAYNACEFVSVQRHLEVASSACATCTHILPIAEPAAK